MCFSQNGKLMILTVYLVVIHVALSLGCTYMICISSRTNVMLYSVKTKNIIEILIHKPGFL